MGRIRTHNRRAKRARYPYPNLRDFLAYWSDYADRSISRPSDWVNHFPEPEALPDDLYSDGSGLPYFYCRSCDGRADYDGAIADFSQEMAYCGRSPGCLP